MILFVAFLLVTGLGSAAGKESQEEKNKSITPSLKIY
jgi:hypothetical protein